MRVVFAIIGLLFDLIILAAAGFALYCAVQPDFFFYSVKFASDFLETDAGRIQTAGGAAVFILLAFRGFFLVFFGKGDPVYIIKRDNTGTLSISRATLEHLISRLSGAMNPPASMRNLKIVQSDKGLEIRMKIRLDIAKCNLGEYTKELDGFIRGYFNNSLGIQIISLHVEAVADTESEGAIKPPAREG